MSQERGDRRGGLLNLWAHKQGLTRRGGAEKREGFNRENTVYDERNLITILHRKKLSVKFVFISIYVCKIDTTLKKMPKKKLEYTVRTRL